MKMRGNNNVALGSNTFAYDAIDFSNMTFFFSFSTHSIELNHKNTFWTVKTLATTMAKNKETYDEMLILRCTY